MQETRIAEQYAQLNSCTLTHPLRKYRSREGVQAQFVSNIFYVENSEIATSYRRCKNTCLSVPIAQTRVASSSSGSGCTRPSRQPVPAQPSSRAANGPASAPRFQVHPEDNGLAMSLSDLRNHLLSSSWPRFRGAGSSCWSKARSGATWAMELPGAILHRTHLANSWSRNPKKNYEPILTARERLQTLQPLLTPPAWSLKISPPFSRKSRSTSNSK